MPNHPVTGEALCTGYRDYCPKSQMEVNYAVLSDGVTVLETGPMLCGSTKEFVNFGWYYSDVCADDAAKFEYIGNYPNPPLNAK